MQFVLLSLMSLLVALCVAFVLELPWKGIGHHLSSKHKWKFTWICFAQASFLVWVSLSSSFSLPGKPSKDLVWTDVFTVKSWSNSFGSEYVFKETEI